MPTQDLVGRRVWRSIELAWDALRMSATEFDAFIARLIGLPVSHLWRGYGSALFLEFGELQADARTSGDGTAGSYTGEMSLMVEWSWRIEGRRSILCGSWSDEKKWPRAFRLVRNAKVANAALFGRLPEIELSLSNETRVLSFMTAEGNPEWTLFDRRGDETRWLHVRHGVVRIEASEPRFPPRRGAGNRGALI
jgi:hypothetical protein